LDEPEVHLHPEWQLKYAAIIVELVKNGINILVNSHSPYMVEALKRYSEIEKIEEKTNFYLAEEGYITKQESLENIFEKLALPMRELKKLKMDRYLND
jgi:predicted ATPase